MVTNLDAVFQNVQNFRRVFWPWLTKNIAHVEALLSPLIIPIKQLIKQTKKQLIKPIKNQLIKQIKKQLIKPIKNN